eukprot:TRINITY_DN5887_c0_g1_i1.p1 TRINITY_DN5887_c0_g1~~TRINITY_DN5887_c0_g1_i1.p1  ORF type:complete len:551 (+),score=154.47 TRINITY_DN5887_c0_g1_i1:485-2137(+)
MKRRIYGGLALCIRAQASAANGDKCWAAAADAAASAEAAAAQCEMIGCAHLDDLPESWSRDYPLTPAMLARVAPYSGNTRRLREKLRRARAGGKLTVVALGGSVTMGIDTDEDPAAWPERRWCRRLEAWLRARFPAAAVEMQVRAYSGCHSICQLQHLFKTMPKDGDIDIILLDTASNDAWMRHGHQYEIGNLELQEDKLAPANEVIVRHALSLRSEPAVIYISSFIASANVRQHWEVQEWVRPILEPYGVHMVSFRDVVWPVFEEQSPAVRDVYWEPRKPVAPGAVYIHPGHRAHQLYADTLAYFLDGQYVAACQEAGDSNNDNATSGADSEAHFRTPTDAPLLPQTAGMEHVLCDGSAPHTSMEPSDPSTFPPGSIVQTAGWAIFPEHKNRTGYIGYGLLTPHAVLELELECHAHPTLSVTYLRSYEQVGVVRVFNGAEPDAAALSGDSARRLRGEGRALGPELVIDALYVADRASTPHTAHLPLDETFLSPRQLVEPPKDPLVKLYSVSFQLLGPPDADTFFGNDSLRDEVWIRGGWKFKILKLACC